jgi:hypothetical protein
MVCLECAGCHRAMGTHVSRMRSLVLDACEPRLLHLTLALHTGIAPGAGTPGPNGVWEATVPAGVRRPPPSDAPTGAGPREHRQVYVRLKYELKEFALPFASLPCATATPAVQAEGGEAMAASERVATAMAEACTPEVGMMAAERLAAAMAAACAAGQPLAVLQLIAAGADAAAIVGGRSLLQIAAQAASENTGGGADLSGGYTAGGHALCAELISQNGGNAPLASAAAAPLPRQVPLGAMEGTSLPLAPLVSATALGPLSAPAVLQGASEAGSAARAFMGTPAALGVPSVPAVLNPLSAPAALGPPGSPTALGTSPPPPGTSRPSAGMAPPPRGTGSPPPGYIYTRDEMAARVAGEVAAASADFSSAVDASLGAAAQAARSLTASLPFGANNLSFGANLPFGGKNLPFGATLPSGLGDAFGGGALASWGGGAGASLTGERAIKEASSTGAQAVGEASCTGGEAVKASLTGAKAVEAFSAGDESLPNATAVAAPTLVAAPAPVPAPTVPAPTVPAPTVPAPSVPAPAPTAPAPTVPAPTVPAPTPIQATHAPLPADSAQPPSSQPLASQPPPSQPQVAPLPPLPPLQAQAAASAIPAYTASAIPAYNADAAGGTPTRALRAAGGPQPAAAAMPAAHVKPLLSESGLLSPQPCPAAPVSLPPSAPSAVPPFATPAAPGPGAQLPVSLLGEDAWAEFDTPTSPEAL